MNEYYYQIKGKASKNNSEGYFGGHTNWVYPPIYSGKVEAVDKKEAHELINEEYNKKFPLRVSKKDLDSNEFLLHIKEINDDKTRSIFEEKECNHCQSKFKVIDHYNNINENYKGGEFCSDQCRRDNYEVKRYEYDLDKMNNGSHVPLIYLITNNKTNKSYVGKTTQAFTLRWYQHFFQGSGTKFHEAIKDANVTDWNFKVIEIVNIDPDKLKTMKEVDDYILERESFWINGFNCIENGYNSVISKK